MGENLLGSLSIPDKTMFRPSLFLCLFLVGTSVTASESPTGASSLTPPESEHLLLGLLFRLMTAIEMGKYPPIVPPPDDSLVIPPSTSNPYSPLFDPTQMTYDDQTDGMMDQIIKKGLGGKKENFFQFGGKRTSFNKYQGKRSSFNKYQGKRFSKYGGKRGDESSPDGEAKENFYQFGGKRGEKFKSFAGKRK